MRVCRAENLAPDKYSDEINYYYEIMETIAG